MRKLHKDDVKKKKNHRKGRNKITRVQLPISKHLITLFYEDVLKWCSNTQIIYKNVKKLEEYQLKQVFT